MDRRDFSKMVGASFVAMSFADGAVAQTRKVIKLANTVVVNDAQQAFTTVGQHPRLGYYAKEGLDIEYVNMSSVAQAMQSIITEEVMVAPAVPGVFLPAYAKDPSIGLIAVYEWLPRNPTAIVVKPDSKIRTAADLAGKRIGIRNQGDPANISTRAMLLELGVNDSTVEFLAVGDGAPAGQALVQNRVDALVTFDTAAARIELLDFALRYVPLPPRFAANGGGWNLVKKSMLKSDRKTVVGFFRAKAKSTLFAHTNLDQSINIHWDLYPESRPKTKSEGEAKKEIAFLMKDRKENWMRRVNDPDQRFGAMSLDEWRNNIALTAVATSNPRLEAEIGDPSNIFTNELVNEINDFDKAAIIKQAREFKL